MLCKIAVPIILLPEEHATLDVWAREGNLPYRKVVRTKTINMAADGVLNQDIAKHLGISRPMVQLWRDRFPALVKSKLTGRSEHCYDHLDEFHAVFPAAKGFTLQNARKPGSFLTIRAPVFSSSKRESGPPQWIRVRLNRWRGNRNCTGINKSRERGK